MASSSKHISLPRPLSEGDPTEWFLKYEICCVANEWSDELKAKKLPTLLEGEALAVWLEMTTEQQGSYERAKLKMIERMAPDHLTISGHGSFGQTKRWLSFYMI